MQTTPDSTTLNDLRPQLHAMWSAVAPAWEAHADYADRRAQTITDQLLAGTRPGRGDRVLELACGPGGVGLQAAGLVAPTGTVVLSDVSEAMVRIAAQRAAARGIGGVQTQIVDLDAIEEPDASYDIVVCREGLMFATDPGACLREIHRVLRPGGRAGVSVWGPRALNPWLAVVLDAVSDHVGYPIPPHGVPGPFALDDPDRLASLLRQASLAGIEVAELATPMSAASPDDWWARVCALAGPVSRLLEALPEDGVLEIRARVDAAAAAYRTADGLLLPGSSLVAIAHRPG